MCGIFGLITRPDTANLMRSQASIAMTAIMKRGPDDFGSIERKIKDWCFLLGHARLSIIDLTETGHQPMESSDTEWLITFNGEIYNYIELRDELLALGWVFKGESDSEVLLKAWSQWGENALNKLNGMFAFAAFNSASGETWLIRDRFGVKPLLWGRLPDGGLVFSSSVAAVAKLATAEVDVSYCARGLRYNAFEVEGSEAPFDGVYAVPTGGWLRVQPTDTGLGITNGCWYDFREAVARKTAAIEFSPDSSVLEECQQLLEDAVRLRLRSDVPIAVSLSSGLDSSSVTALAARHVSGLKGFTYGSPTAKQSEGPIVELFSRSVGVTCEYIWPTFDTCSLDDLLECALMFQEAPFGGLSVLAQNEVFRVVRQAGFKVLLGGQGGDEIFAGYRKFFVVALRQALNSRDIGSTVRMIYSLGLMLFHEASQARMYWQNLGRYSTQKSVEFKLLDWSQPSANLWGDPGTTLSSRQMDDIQQWSIPSLLRFEDRNSMGHGLETRLPFMDYRLVELALSLTARLKIANGYGKWALRQITNGVVPDYIRLNRKKRGFDVTQKWIEEGIGASLRTRIHDHQNVLAQYMKKKVNCDQLLSDKNLARDSNLLNEALMLAWLANPIRLPDNQGLGL